MDFIVSLHRAIDDHILSEKAAEKCDHVYAEAEKLAEKKVKTSQSSG